MKNLKPVTFIQWQYGYGRQNTFQQMLLLKALKVTQDPKELKQMIGVRTVADVYRTLDKMALRKDFHRALEAQGLSFDYILTGIKNIAEDANAKDDVKLKAYLALLKSLGMDKYEESQSGGWSWEDLLLEEQSWNIPSLPEVVEKEVEYEVSMPEMPESLRKKKEEEKEDANSLYG